MYLTALRISVRTGIQSRVSLLRRGFPLRLVGKIKASRGVVPIIDVCYQFKRPLSLALISVTTLDVLGPRRAWGVLGDHISRFLEHMIDYMLTYLKFDGLRKVDVYLGSRPGGEVHLTYYEATAKFGSAASLHNKVHWSRAPQWTLPMLAIVTPYRRVNHYAQEVAHLLSLAQYRFPADGDERETCQPYVLTIHGTRVSALTTTIGGAYLKPFKIMKVRREGLEVVVSEEFDMAVTEEWVKFVSVFEELLVGLVVQKHGELEGDGEGVGDPLLGGPGKTSKRSGRNRGNEEVKKVLVKHQMKALGVGAKPWPHT